MDLMKFVIDTTHLAQVAVATAVNIIQLLNWLRGESIGSNRYPSLFAVHETGYLRWDFRLRHLYRMCYWYHTSPFRAWLFPLQKIILTRKCSPSLTYKHNNVRI